MSDSDSELLVETWALQDDLKSMKKTLKDWEKKSIIGEYKPIYDSFKAKIEEATNRVDLIASKKEKILVQALEEKQEGKEAQFDVIEEDRDLKSQVQELKKENNQLKNDVKSLQKEMNILIKKIVSLSEENKQLSVLAAENKQKYSDLKKEMNEKRLEVNQAEEKQDMIILGDFAYQFQNLLGLVLGQKDGLLIRQVEEMIQCNYEHEGIERLQKLGITDQKSLQKLDSCLYTIKEARNLVGHEAIKTNMKFSLADIEKLAQRRFLYGSVSPIIAAWKLLVKSGEVFDAGTWVLNNSF